MTSSQHSPLYALALRLLVIVSTDASDIFFANQMLKRFPLAGIVLEHQRDPSDPRPRWQKAISLLPKPGELVNRTSAWLGRVWRSHVEEHLYQEVPLDFGRCGQHLDDTADCPILRIQGTGKLNEEYTAEWIRMRSPDLIVVCGASVLQSPILSIPSYGLLNLHGGLSQFYRGLFTTDWAIYNGEPEYVGATIHFVSAGIDDGAVVFQGRPFLGRDDHPNRCYEKVVRLGVEMMSAAVSAIDRGALHEPTIPPPGHLYRSRDFKPAVKRRLWRRWRRSMEEYDRDRRSRDSLVEASLIHPFEEVSATASFDGQLPQRPIHHDAVRSR